MESEAHGRIDSLVSHLERARREQIRNDIARRLQRACSHLAEEEFRQLVELMTDRQIKGERRVTQDFLLE